MTTAKSIVFAIGVLILAGQKNAGGTPEATFTTQTIESIISEWTTTTRYRS